MSSSSAPAVAKRQRDGAADAAPGAGDQRHLAVEAERRCRIYFRLHRVKPISLAMRGLHNATGPFPRREAQPIDGSRSVIRSERYIAFLLSTLPKLAQTRLYGPRWPFPLRRFAVLDRALRVVRPLPGIALVFGVYRGRSLRHAARRQRARKFYGFDSFESLPPDGHPDWQIDFATTVPPKVPANCRLIPGWFADTVPLFLRADDSGIAFVGIDCDVYSSAREVLFGLGERLRPGTILYFDEPINYDIFLWNEMLALFEFLDATGMGVEWIGAHCRVRSLPEVFELYEAGAYPAWRADIAAGYHRPAAAILTTDNGDLDLLQNPAQAARIAALAATLERFTERYRAMRAQAARASGSAPGSGPA